MIKYLRDQFTMAQSVEHLFNTETSVWSGIIPLANAKNELSNLLADTMLEFSKSLRVNTGVTIDKQNKRTDLEQKAFVISSRLTSYLSITANTETIDSARFTKTDLKKMKGNELIGACYNLHKLASDHIANLAPYLILPATLTDFTSTINAFNREVNAPTEQRKSKKEANQATKKLISDCMSLLYNRLDHAIYILQDTHPDFVALYKITRQIKNSPTHRRSIYTLCLDAETKLPIAGIQLKIDNKKTIRLSGPKGKNYVQNLSSGKHQLITEHKDYHPQTIAFTVVANKMTKLVIELERNED